MKMVYAVVRSSKVEIVARSLKKLGVSGCTIYPVQGYGVQWNLYEPLIHGAHHKLEAIVEDGQVENAVRKIIEEGWTGVEGDGIVSVFSLDQTVLVKSKKVLI